MRFATTLMFLVLVSLPLHATTWHVAKDGSGDFTVIQDAVDAASPGDTIRIHAGRYEEVVEDFDLWGDGSILGTVHVAVTVDNLTFVGDGVEQTFIGPESPPSSTPDVYIGFCVTDAYAGSVSVSGLMVQSADVGVYLASTTANVDNLVVVGAGEGISVQTSESCDVVDCAVLDSEYGITSFAPTRNLSVLRSTFTRCYSAYTCGGSINTLVEECIAIDMHSGFNIQQGSSAILRGVAVDGYIATGLGVSSGSEVEVYDSAFLGGMVGLYSYGESLRCERTRFEGQNYRAVYINSSGATVVSECELLNGGEATVECSYNGSGDCHVDMTNNYWGTDSEAQIAEWISDSIEDPDRCCTVDFIPFNDESTPTETKSWSSVKGLFESGGEE